MNYDIFFILFILISFIYGLYRGIKREISFFVIFSISLFGILFSYNTIIDLVNGFINISDISELINKFSSVVGIQGNYIVFLVLVILPIIIVSLLLNGLINLIFFKKKYNTIDISKKGRLFGGLLGILVGIEMAILMMFVLNGLFDISFDGISKLLVENIPNFKQILSETSHIIESEVTL